MEHSIKCDHLTWRKEDNQWVSIAGTNGNTTYLMTAIRVAKCAWVWKCIIEKGSGLPLAGSGNNNFGSLEEAIQSATDYASKYIYYDSYASVSPSDAHCAAMQLERYLENLFDTENDLGEKEQLDHDLDLLEDIQLRWLTDPQEKKGE